MKKNIITTLIAISFASFAFSSTVQPTLSMRFNDLIGETNSAVAPVLCLGLAMELDEGVTAGFDSAEGDSRIFVSFDYGTMGLGISNGGKPQFTIGTSYSTLSNLTVSLDYIFNNLAGSGSDDDEDDEPNTVPNELRLSLGVTF